MFAHLTSLHNVHIPSVAHLHKFWLQSLDKIFLHQSLHKTKEEKDRAVIAQLTSMHTVHCTVRTQLNSVGFPVLPNVWTFAQFYTVSQLRSFTVTKLPPLTCVHSWTVASLHKKRCSWYLSKTFTRLPHKNKCNVLNSEFFVILLCLSFTFKVISKRSTYRRLTSSDCSQRMAVKINKKDPGMFHQIVLRLEPRRTF